MRLLLSVFLVLVFVAFVSPSAPAQESTSAAQTADNLRLDLITVQAKEEAFKARAMELDEALKPENIQRALAGVGSTRPEELREQLRRQLTIERDGVRAQLEVLAASRVRLEAAIQTADTQAYHDSARGYGDPQLNAMRGAWSTLTRPVVLLGVASLVVLFAVAGFFLVTRRYVY